MIRKTGLALMLGLAVTIFGNPTLAPAQSPAAVGGLQIISSTIGDFDCFGYGAPVTKPADPRSPCGTLPGLPIADVTDWPNTDVVVDCTAGNTFSFTHTLDIPLGATILGGSVVVNVGGIEKSTFNTQITADGLPALTIPDTGALGTGLVVIPLIGASKSLLNDGQVVVTIRHGANLPTVKCDPVFVDSSTVSVLVHVPLPQ
jgi:hypothetical protein